MKLKPSSAFTRAAGHYREWEYGAGNDGRLAELSRSEEMSAMRLWDYGDELAGLDRTLDEVGLSEDEKGAAIEEYLRGNAPLQEKIDGYCGLIRSLEATSKARKDEATRISDLARYDQNKADALKSRLKDFLELTNAGKVQTTHYIVSVVNNGGALPMTVAPVGELDEEFVRQVVSVVADTQLIRDRLEAGYNVSGCALGERGRRLSIR